MSEENVYNIKEENSLGQVQIADDVVAIIAGLAASEVEGVYKLAGNFSNELASKLGKKNPAKGVKVELLPGKVKVDVSIEVLYEYSIPAVSSQVQDKVKQAIETMTGLVVEEVNIRITGVRVADTN
ncbi:MAG: Asp23/Gls24 family envelope stress response protein [Coprococcus sp.]|nr:Asp23/Gls24 family envelope stress response protein [Coprococcus sp.]